MAEGTGRAQINTFPSKRGLKAREKMELNAYFATLATSTTSLFIDTKLTSNQDKGTKLPRVARALGRGNQLCLNFQL
jgi:hypothetical protein